MDKNDLTRKITQLNELLAEICLPARTPSSAPAPSKARNAKHCPECGGPLIQKSPDISWCMWHGHYIITPIADALAEHSIELFDLCNKIRVTDLSEKI